MSSVNRFIFWKPHTVFTAKNFFLPITYSKVHYDMQAHTIPTFWMFLLGKLLIFDLSFHILEWQHWDVREGSYWYLKKVIEVNIISISENRNASSLVTAHVKFQLSLKRDPCELGDVRKHCFVAVLPFALPIRNKTKQKLHLATSYTFSPQLLVQFK